MFTKTFVKCCHKMYLGVVMDSDLGTKSQRSRGSNSFKRGVRATTTPSNRSSCALPPPPSPLSPCLACPPRAGPRFLDVPQRRTRGTTEKPREIPGSFPAKFRESGVLSRARLPARLPPPAPPPPLPFLLPSLLRFCSHSTETSSPSAACSL